MEAFYIAKMKYGQGAHILDLPLLHHALGEEGRHEVHGVRLEMAGTHWQLDGGPVRRCRRP